MSKHAVKKIRPAGGGAKADADPGANHGPCGSGRYFRLRVRSEYAGVWGDSLSGSNGEEMRYRVDERDSIWGGRANDALPVRRKRRRASKGRGRKVGKR